MKKFKKLISIIMILFLIIGLYYKNPTLALSIDQNKVYIETLSDNSLIVTQNDENSLINIVKEGNKLIFNVTNLDTGSVEYFIRDESKGTIYSSITDRTFAISDLKNTIGFEKNIETSYFDEISLSTSDNSPDQTSSHRISYKTLVAYVGISAGVATIIAGILTILAIPAAAGGVATIISGMIVVIQSGLALSDENSGLIVYTGRFKYKKYQGGAPVVGYIFKVYDVGTY